MKESVLINFTNKKEKFIVEEEQEEELNLEKEDVIKIQKYTSKNSIEEEQEEVLLSIDRTYKKVYRIEPIDLLSLEINEINKMITEYFQALKNFSSKLKLLTLNENYNFQEQIQGLYEKMEKTKTNSNLLAEYDREIGKLEEYEKKNKVEFYFIIFGSDIDEIIKNKKKFENAFSSNFFIHNELKGMELKKFIRRTNNL